MYLLSKEYDTCKAPSHQYECDTANDLTSIPSPHMGDTAIVIHGSNGLEVYKADSEGAWVKL